MSSTFTMCKITISLPQYLILAEAKARSETQLAAEGYQFYAQEATAFAGSSEQAVTESWVAEAWAMPQSQEQNS